MTTVWNKFKPTQKQRGLVETASSFGVTQADISEQLGIDLKTLRKYFRAELNSGKFKLDMKAGKAISGLMNDKDPRVKLEAAKWYSARRMGWKETSVTENVGKDGGPIETRDVSAIDVIREQIASATERLEDKSDQPNREISSDAGLSNAMPPPFRTK